MENKQSNQTTFWKDDAIIEIKTGQPSTKVEEYFKTVKNQIEGIAGRVIDRQKSGESAPVEEVWVMQKLQVYMADYLEVSELAKSKGLNPKDLDLKKIGEALIYFPGTETEIPETDERATIKIFVNRLRNMWTDGKFKFGFDIGDGLYREH